MDAYAQEQDPAPRPSSWSLPRVLLLGPCPTSYCLVPRFLVFCLRTATLTYRRAVGRSAVFPRTAAAGSPRYVQHTPPTTPWIPVDLGQISLLISRESTATATHHVERDFARLGVDVVHRLGPRRHEPRRLLDVPAARVHVQFARHLRGSAADPRVERRVGKRASRRSE